jgi:hypothetical protein
MVSVTPGQPPWNYPGADRVGADLNYRVAWVIHHDVGQRQGAAATFRAGEPLELVQFDFLVHLCLRSSVTVLSLKRSIVMALVMRAVV